MKNLVIISVAISGLTGCSLFYDAPRTDSDYGLAQQLSWNKQVAFPHPANVDRIPEGLGGLPAEELMKIYNQSFGVKPSKNDIFSMGLIDESSSGSKP